MTRTAPTTTGPRPQPAAGPAPAAWRVVVVDDSPDDRAEARRLLLKGSDRRYQFAEAETGAAAVAAALAGPPDCLLLDYNLPDLDAPDVLAALAGPDGLPVCPVVVVTGSAGAEMGRAVLRAGAQDYIGKDWLTPEGLTRAVENAAERWAMARELKDKERQLALAFEAAELTYFAWDVPADRVERRLSRLPSLPSTNGVGRGPTTFAGVAEAVHPDDRAAFERTVRAALAGGGRYANGYRVTGPDGAPVWVEEQGQVEFDARGRPVRLVGVARDVSARVRVEEALRASEERYRVLADALPHMTWVTRPDHTVEYANRMQAAYTGLSVDELNAVGWPSLVHPDDRDRLWAEVAGPLARGEPHEAEYRLRWHDGSYRWVVTRAVPVTDPAGRVERWVGTTTDIDARRRAEEAVQASEAFRRASFDQLAFFAGVMELDGTLVEANRGPLDAAGLTRADVLGRKFWETPWWDYDPAVQARVRDAADRAARGETVRLDIAAMMRGGPMPLDFQVAPLRDQTGRVTHLIPSAIDITARKQAERAVRESEERFHLAFAAVSAVIYDWDIAADRVTRSAELRSLLGYENSEPGVATNAWYLARLHPDDAARAAGVVRDAIAGGADRFEDEYRMRHRDGHYVWVRDCGLFLKDAAGRAARCVGSVTDIDRRKEAERRLRESEERFHLAVRAVTGVVWEWDLRTGHVYRSDGLFALTGVRPEDAAPTRDWWADRIHPDDLARLTAATGDLLATAGQFSGDYRVRHADGHWVDVWERGLIERGPDGRPVRLVGFTADVTARKRAEAELARSEAFARSVVESSADCVTGLSVDGRLVWMNENGKRLMEVCDFDRLEGCDWAAFWDQGGVRAEAEAALAAARAGGVGRFRGFCPTAAGTPRWWDVAVTPVPGPDGTVAQLLSVSRDVTAARAAEEAIQEAQALTQTVIDGSTALIFAKHLDGRYFLTNRAWREFVGLSAEQAAGATDDRVFGPEVAGVIRANDRRALDADQPIVVEESAEFRGRRVVYLSSKFPLRDEAGRVYAVCGVSSDITDLKRAQAALQGRERELQTLADNTPDVLTRFDRDLRHVFVNAAVEKATGRPRADFLGKTNRDLGMPADLCDQWDAALTEVFDSGQHRSLEFAFDGPAGPRHYAARLVPEPGPDGRVEFVLGVTHDVTDRRRFEQTLADQDKRKDEFLATLAHELRNPLAPIRNGLQILRLAGDLGAAVGKARDMMERQLGHLVNLVDDLLDISRVSQGKITLKRERLAVREAVEAAVEACRPSVDAKGHALALDLPAEPLPVDADRTRLVQVVANLLTNAAKYSDPGGRIAVTARREGDEVVVAVADTGLGIAPHLLPTLWDLFTQVRDTLDKAQGGLGIGLALVKKLVEMHGGTVAAHSDGVGRGSTFTVRLPLAAGGHTAGAPRPASGDPPPAPRPAGRRVLVVDDNADGAESLSELLRLLGHEVRTAPDGPAALGTARAFRPAVVLCDIGLPGMDGYEVARRLRADAATAGAVLVAVTGWGSDDDRRKSREAGFDRHLTKPVAPTALVEVLAGKRT